MHQAESRQGESAGLAALGLGRLRWAVVVVALAASVGCGGHQGGPGGTPDGGRPDASVGPLDGGDDGSAGGDVSRSGSDGGDLAASPMVISTAMKRPRTTTWSVNYWTWPVTYGDDVTGTETLVGALKPAVMRVGGYNNDANRPDVFDHAQLDKAIAYARAIGAEPLLQVPHLAGADGGAPSPQAALDMVTYANVTRAYAVKYFSVGNEPDLYATSGLPSDPTMPAIPGYGPADFCTSARAYVTAMKAVDPTIQIVGPDLAYQYLAWLPTVLQQCGDLFDIVAIHRYPFSAAAATLPAVTADVAAFRSVMTSVRQLMQANGAGQKPLALMEMNVAYDATPAVNAPSATPGTVPAALWLADVLGEAIELNLWTSAVWDISDPDDWSLGILGLPPAHTPRPEYYAYALYADHFGPTLVDVTSSPSGVDGHASRNPADDATEVIAVNWRSSPVAVGFQVTGLPAAPAPPIYQLPALSVTAVEIPDVGPASASTYGDPQHRAAAGPQPLALGAGVIVDGGVAVDGGVDMEAGPLVCPGILLPSASITTLGKTTAAGIAFGPPNDLWGSYTYAGTGQALPVLTLTPGGNGFEMTGQLTTPAGNANYVGAGLYYSSAGCADVSAYSGVKFDLAGTLGGCTLAFGLVASGNVTLLEDPNRGACPGTSVCYGPAVNVAPSATTVSVPFSALSGGMPTPLLDATKVVSAQWQLTAPIGGCSADVTVANLTLY
jgi:hypothetical protein